MGLAIAVLVLGLCGQAQASFWEGGDWADRDFTPANGDILSGIFTNIGRFLINAGDTILAGSGSVSLMTHDSVIDGVFYGGAALAPRLELIAQTAITLNGALDQWSCISLTSGGNITIGVGASILILNSSGGISHVELPSGGLLQPSGSVIVEGRPMLGPVPLPPALLLFAPGLAGILCARRRSSR